jgi:hypothetical protein
MKRFLILAIAGVFVAAHSGCYEPAYIPPKPTPAEIVRDNAAEVIGKTFAGKADLKANLAKFLEKLGEATTTAELHAAWEEVYPGYPNVVYKTISKSLIDFYWPVAPVTDGRVFVEGFRAGAEQISQAATPPQS